MKLVFLLLTKLYQINIDYLTRIEYKYILPIFDLKTHHKALRVFSIREEVSLDYFFVTD